MIYLQSRNRMQIRIDLPPSIVGRIKILPLIPLFMDKVPQPHLPRPLKEIETGLKYILPFWILKVFFFFL